MPVRVASGTGAAPLAPEEILRLDEEAADALLDRLEENVPAAPSLVELPESGAREAVVFGDSHGDWRSVVAVARRFLERPDERCLIGLGDYVDRAPADCGAGSVANSLYLLGLRASYPDRVFLLQGNHETARRIAVLPHELAEEVDQLWGPEVDRYARILGLLERGPLALATVSGAYFAHAGFPRTTGPGTWREAFDRVSDDLLLNIVWGECGASHIRRGVEPPFTHRDLLTFLTAAGASVFLRGHDPDLNGRWVFDDRCLTLHTTRHYERLGGVLCARVPLDRKAVDARAIRVEHVETEGRTFPDPD